MADIGMAELRAAAREMEGANIVRGAGGPTKNQSIMKSTLEEAREPMPQDRGELMREGRGEVVIETRDGRDRDDVQLWFEVRKFKDPD